MQEAMASITNLTCLYKARAPELECMELLENIVIYFILIKFNLLLYKISIPETFYVVVVNPKNGTRVI